MRFSILLAATAVSLSMAAPAAAQTIYTDRAAFDAATTGQTVTAFEENGDAAFTSYPAGYTGAGFVITSSTRLFTVDPQYDPFYEFGTGDVLDFEAGIGTFTIGSGVTAFGFSFGSPTDFNSDTGFITINGVDYAELDQPAFSFFGIVDDAPLGPITINFNGGLGIVDNVVTGIGGAVPEPATWALMIIGFGAVGGSMRSRRRTTQVTFAA